MAERLGPPATAVDGGPEAVGDECELLDVSHDGEHGELLTAHPHEEIALTRDLLNATRHRDQHCVPLLVSEVVVDGLEVVQVENQAAQSLAGTIREGTEKGCAQRQTAPVRDSRERVLERVSDCLGGGAGGHPPEPEDRKQ